MDTKSEIVPLRIKSQTGSMKKKVEKQAAETNDA